jgi:hypothetical protein
MGTIFTGRTSALELSGPDSTDYGCLREDCEQGETQGSRKRGNRETEVTLS